MTLSLDDHSLHELTHALCTINLLSLHNTNIASDVCVLLSIILLTRPRIFTTSFTMFLCIDFFIFSLMYMLWCVKVFCSTSYLHLLSDCLDVGFFYHFTDSSCIVSFSLLDILAVLWTQRKQLKEHYLLPCLNV